MIIQIYQVIVMSDEYRMREYLQNKIKQRMATNQSGKQEILDYSNNLLTELESMKQSFHSQQQPSKILEGMELDMQIKREREVQHKLQMNIEKLRFRMMETIKEQDRIKQRIVEKRKQFHSVKQNLQKDHATEMEQIQHQYELKRENILEQIEQLIEEKKHIINQIEDINKDIQKADARNKRAQENYAKQMKSRKEAFLSIEKQKSNKYEQTRVQQLKEKAIKDTEPKLLAIIKSSTEDIKKAEQQQRKQVDTFKIQYKIKLQKDLTDAKQRVFEQGEQQKEQLRTQTQRRNREKYDQKEAELSQELSRIRQQYSQRIREQEKRIRTQVQEFMERNREFHSENIDQIKQLKSTYEAKLKKMSENIEQMQQKKLAQYESKYKRLYQQQVKEIDESGQQKYKIAQEKICKDVGDKIQKIKRQIQKEKTSFIEDIDKKYEKILITEQSRLEDQSSKERKQCQAYQQKLITLQQNKVREEARTQQFQKERNGLMGKCEDLQRKIAAHQAQMRAYERYKLQKEKQTQKKSEQLGLVKKQQFQQLKDKYLAKQEEKQGRLKELLDEFQQVSNMLSSQLQQYRGEIEANISKRKGELQKIMQQNGRLERENEILQREIQDQSRRLRS